MTALCVLDHDVPRMAAHPLVVCTWHADRITRAIAETPARYAALVHYLAPTGNGNNGRVTGTPDIGININPRVSQLRADIRNTVSTWARIAIETRGMNPPDNNIPAICTFLVHQVDWYLAQPWTQQFANDMDANWRDAGAIIIGNQIRVIEIAPCPETGCTGRLYARLWLRPKDGLLPADIACDDSPEDDDGMLTHYWTADKWITLGRKIRKVSA